MSNARSFRLRSHLSATLRKLVRRGRSATLIGSLLITATPCAKAALYASTVAGVRQLVADDSKILPPSYAAKLKGEETGWEKQTGRYCYISADKRFPPECLFPAQVISDIQSRIFSIDGMVIDGDDWAFTNPVSVDEAGEPSGLPVTLRQYIPRIVAPSTAATAKFNREFRQFAEAFWASYGGPPVNHPKRDDLEDFILTYGEVDDPLPGTISIFLDLGVYVHGAGRGGDYNNVFNWLIADRRTVRPGDIFNLKTDWEDGVTAAMPNTAGYAALIGPNGQPVIMHSHGVGVDPARWHLTRHGLEIDFTTDEGPGADPGSASTSWATLAPYLKKGGLAAPRGK